MADDWGQLVELAREGSHMIIVLKPGTQDADVEDVCRRIEGLGLRAHVSRGEQRTIIGAIGDDRFKTRLQALEALDCVESMVPILQPFKLASREVHATDSVVEVNGVRIGGQRLTVMAGPCSVESEAQLVAVAESVKAGGAHILRGGGLQAADLALRVPGARGGGPPAARRGPEANGAPGGDRGARARQGRVGRRVR
jgi:3-deoxy-7-phosphoheptulonate synthase